MFPIIKWQKTYLSPELCIVTGLRAAEGVARCSRRCFLKNMVWSCAPFYVDDHLRRHCDSHVDPRSIGTATAKALRSCRAMPLTSQRCVCNYRSKLSKSDRFRSNVEADNTRE